MEYAFLLMTKRKESSLEEHIFLAPQFVCSFKQFCLPV